MINDTMMKLHYRIHIEMLVMHTNVTLRSGTSHWLLL